MKEKSKWRYNDNNNIFRGPNGEKIKRPKGVVKFFSRMCSSIASKLMPNEYEDIIAVNRSTLSFNSEIFKMSNLVSFNPKNTNEVKH